MSPKWHLTKMASNVFWKYYQHHANRTSPTIRNKLGKLDFKIPWPLVCYILEIEEFTLKNHSAQPLGDNIWQFFGKVCHFCKSPFLWVLYLSTLGGTFVMCHFRKVPLFSYGIKGYFFCWVVFLLGVSDGAVFVLFYS